ncbi:unannotated protein [freshwater metagenome]|uniref:Unannotated protein n=1 Tax=freshwater metagenome TaxID=449393 RepID=A0A6J6LJD5_9ZZZZ
MGLSLVDCAPSMTGTTMKRTDSGASKRPAREVCPRTIPYIAALAFSRTVVSGISQCSSIFATGPLMTEYEMPHPKPNGAPGNTRESPMKRVR